MTSVRCATVAGGRAARAAGSSMPSIARAAPGSSFRMVAFSTAPQPLAPSIWPMKRRNMVDDVAAPR